MAQVEKLVLVPYSSQQMFELVDQVELYPQFMPWCGGTAVLSRDERETVATIHINYHHVKHSFTTRNRKEHPSLIEVRLIEGPFKHLDGTWRFIRLDDQACKIDFKLHYEFSSKMLERLVGPVFNHVAKTFVHAFIERAEKVYGVS